MSPDEIHDAQRPYRRVGARDARVRACRRRPPAALGRFQRSARRDRRAVPRSASAQERNDGKPLSQADRQALRVLGLDHDADRRALRTRYSELVRKFHPDRNGGDRSTEKALQEVIAAYQQLKGSPAFA